MALYPDNLCLELPLNVPESVRVYPAHCIRQPTLLGTARMRLRVSLCFFRWIYICPGIPEQRMGSYNS
jgi:hypothetical protein